ncbi:MAG TPA: hypothetical protein VK862_01350 [Afifellaceae bacterium]|nr:hypothetical protein [Afifellaceae bacterium]
MTCSSHISAVAGRQSAGALCELRGPLAALAVIALVFQFALPLVAAKAGPEWQTALSVCLGNGDNGQDRQDPAGHSGACACGAACAHGACGGCGLADRIAVAVEQPGGGDAISMPSGGQNVPVLSGDGVTRSRAPPIAA